MEVGTSGSMGPASNQLHWLTTSILVKITTAAIVSRAFKCRPINCFVQGTISVSTKKLSSKPSSTSNTTSGQFCLPVVHECHSCFRKLHSQMGTSLRQLHFAWSVFVEISKQTSSSDCINSFKCLLISEKCVPVCLVCTGGVQRRWP